MLTHNQIRPGEIKCQFTCSNVPSKDFFLHCHNHYEIFYILEGEVSYLAEGNCYQPTPGSLMVFPPHAFHGVKVLSRRPYQRYTLFFYDSVLPVELKSFLLSIFPVGTDITNAPLYFPGVEPLMLEPLFRCLVQCDQIDQAYRSSMSAVYLEALLGRLTFLSSGPATGTSSDRDARISEVLQYINDHLAEPMSLDHLSGRFFISKNHLNVLFRDVTGTTIGDYLINKRVVRAQQLIMNGARTADAAAMAGFSDYSAFFRSYEKILGHRPSQDKITSVNRHRKSI